MIEKKVTRLVGRRGGEGQGTVTHSFDLVDIVFLVGIEFGMMKRRGRRHGGRGVKLGGGLVLRVKGVCVLRASSNASPDV